MSRVNLDKAKVGDWYITRSGKKMQIEKYERTDCSVNRYHINGKCYNIMGIDDEGDPASFDIMKLCKQDIEKPTREGYKQWLATV